MIKRIPNLSAIVLAVLLATGCATRYPNSLAAHDSSKWNKEITEMVAADATNAPPQGGIVFVGSSSIRLWKTLATDFPGRPIINRGFGGSQLADSVFYADRLVIPYHPRQVVIYAGGNDLQAGKEPAVVFGDLVALVEKIRAELPRARIAYIASAPNPARWKNVEKVKELNRLAADYCKRHGLDFIDVFPLMLGADGLPLPDIFVADRLHMNAKGYEIWRKVVEGYLVK